MLSLPLKGDIQLVGPEAIGDGEDLKISIAFWGSTDGGRGGL
jgi:hypothetical protein